MDNSTTGKQLDLASLFKNETSSALFSGATLAKPTVRPFKPKLNNKNGRGATKKGNRLPATPRMALPFFLPGAELAQNIQKEIQFDLQPQI